MRCLEDSTFCQYFSCFCLIYDFGFKYWHRTVGFVIGFSTFLLGCVDYSRIRPDGDNRLSDIIVGRCVSRCVFNPLGRTHCSAHTTSRFSGFTLIFFILFTAFFAWQLVTFALGIIRLVDMYRFYTYLLHIPDVRADSFSL